MALNTSIQHLATESSVPLSVNESEYTNHLPKNVLSLTITMPPQPTCLLRFANLDLLPHLGPQRMTLAVPKIVILC